MPNKHLVDMYYLLYHVFYGIVQIGELRPIVHIVPKP